MRIRVTSQMLLLFLVMSPARAITNQFFNPSQPATVVASNITSGTLSSSGYLFSYTADGYWSPAAGGPPTGRYFSVFWPSGVQAQAVTAGADVGGGANITVRRVDGQSFGLHAFKGKLLANTAATGGAFEIMPQVDGKDAFADPLMYDATGYAGNMFPHMPALSGYDTYVIHLWVDWALVGLTLVDDGPLLPAAMQVSVTPVNALQISWPDEAVGYVLQASPSLPADWTTVTNLAQSVSTNIQVTVPLSGNARFFRLQAGE